MGQRLVIDLIQDDKIVAAIYYHWSAYFASTIEELAKLSKIILKAEKENKDKLFSIVKTLEKDEVYRGIYEEEVRCGGVCGRPEEKKAAMNLFPNYIPKEDHVDRNCGLIAFTKEGIDSFHDWEEGHADINLDTYKINNNVYLDPYPYDVDMYGAVSINGKTYDVSAYDCDCESIIKLAEFMEKERVINDRTE